MASLNSYGKLNEAERIVFRRKTKKRIAIIIISSIVLLSTLLAALLGTTHKPSDSKSAQPQGTPGSIKDICSLTQYPNTCRTSLSQMGVAEPHPEYLFVFSLRAAIAQVSLATNRFMAKTQQHPAFGTCQVLLSLSEDHLKSSLEAAGSNLTLSETFDDVRTWLSTAGTYQQTCVDSVQESLPKSDVSTVSDYLRNATELTSNALAIVTKLSGIVELIKLRRLMSVANIGSSGITANAVVAKDGSGKYKKIGDALKAVPSKSKKKYVIYVKKGVYHENVVVDKSMYNVMLVGDGMDATVISGSLNAVDGTITFLTATVAVFGKGFMAQDIGFCNTAGAAKHQAVALLSSSDKSVFHRCRIDAFQDTLYAHSNRQLYRECVISGTVDFIFGNSAVVIQNSLILAKLPLSGQENTITAQGKFDPNQNTGIAFQNCKISADAGLTPSVQTYLGRPWKAYSTTVYIKSALGSLIEPEGWLPWIGTTAPDTIYYGEYQNLGPGSSTDKRVKWKGVKSLSSAQASKFTTKSFIKSDKWPSNSGLR